MVDFFKKHYYLVVLMLLVGAIGIRLLGNSKSVVLTAEGIRQYDYNRVNVGDELIAGTSRVTFDAFLLNDNDLDGVAEKYRGQSINVTGNDKLWLELKVLGDVTLKDAYIEFVSTNVKVEGSIVKDSTFKDTIIADDITKIELNEVNVGTTKLFYLGLNPSLTNDISSYSKTNKVVFKGTIVENGVEKAVEKEVEYLINWYGLKNAVDTYIDEEYKASAPTVKIASDDNITVTYNFDINERKDIMPLESTDFEASVGKLNGYDPISVKVEGINTTFTYDQDSHKITASHDSVLENNIIKQNAYSYTRNVFTGNITDLSNSNKYERVTNFVVTVVYPHAAAFQDGTATLNVEAWHDMYNNDVLTSSITSGTKADKTLIANYKCDGSKGNVTTILSSIRLGKSSGATTEEYYIDKTNSLNMYNGIGNNDTTYELSILPYVNFYNPYYPVDKIFITDLGADKVNGTIDMGDFTSYRSIKLPENISEFLGLSGYVKVIDNDTGEVLHVFTSLDFDKTYIFEKNVKSVTLEISNLIDDPVIRRVSNGLPANLFTIIVEKKIDNKYLINNVDLATFNSWEYITTSVRTDWTAGEYSSKTDPATVSTPGRVIQSVSARFSNGLSNFSFESDTSSIEAAQEKQVKFNIRTANASSDSLYKHFKDAEFLVLIPDEIMSFEVNDILIKNNTSSVDIDSYEVTKIGDHKFLKIATRNANPATYGIEVDATIIADPAVINKTVDFTLYVYNPYCHNYGKHTKDIYDVNNNNDLNEEVGYEKVQVNLLAPTEVITTTTLIDYNGKTVSSPLIGEISPDHSQAAISVNLINNSQFAIKDLVIIGKIGFVGNTYQVGDQNALLGSEFNTTMISAITPPASLASKTKIYYSTQEKPTSSLTEPSNGWTENVTDFSNIKTYMIVVDDYEMNTGEIQKFTYNVDMPIATANLLKKTYFTHGVYYNAITDRGLVESSTGSSKLGVTYVRKYDLNVKTFRKGTDKLITPIKYLITDDQGNSKTLKADVYGNLNFDGLYVNQSYTLRQISIDSNYELSDADRTFRVEVGAGDNLVLTNSNNYKSITLTNQNKLNVEVENNVRYTVVIKNTDLQTNANISGSKFRITGKGYEDGYTTVTNVNGELTLKGLYLNEAYTLEQTFANGHEKVDGEFRVRVVYDKTDNKIKMCIEKVPEITTFTNTTDSSSTVFQKTSSFADNSGTFRNTSSTTTNRTKAYMTLDLTAFEDKYRFTLNGNYGYHGHTEVFLTDFYVSSMSSLSSSLNSYTYDHTNSSTNTYMSTSLTKAKQSNGNEIDLAGGKKYYLYVYQYPLTNKSLAAFTVSVSAESGIQELVKTNLLTTNINGNDKLIQTIEDDLTKDQPVLRVQVKNQVIPKTTIKIVKKDAESGTVLKNAQYRVEGPSISGQGLILTTDENGEATFEAYEKYTGNDYYYVGLSNSSEVYDNPYTVTEIAAPDGYSLDTKPVVFYVENNIKCPTTGTCDINNYIDDVKIRYETNEFINTSYDSSTDTMSVEVHDYPIVKIVKRDGETGELLPNTLFSISKVKRKDGKETLSQALDINGNPVGNLVRINDEDLYVISTNSKGALNLNLQVGQYKLKEVQASSDKYELANQVYYFGVGETVPFQAEGINLVDSFYVGNSSFISFNTYNDYSDFFKPVTGGYIGSNRSVITKYNLDGSVAWTKDFAGQLKYKKKYTYFDKDDIVIQDIPTTISGVKDIVELSNGDILIVFHSDGQSLVRLDKDGNTLWIEDVFENITYYTRRDVKNPNTNYQSYLLTDVDNEVYSGAQSVVNNRKQLVYAITPDKNGGFVLICMNTNYMYYNDMYQGYKLKDGSLLEYGKEYNSNGSYHDRNGNFNSYSKSLFVLKYDNENDIVSGKEISKTLLDTAKSYFADKGYTISPNYIGYYSGYSFGDIDLYDDGGLIFSVYNVANIDYAMKLDNNYNLVYYAPIVINGKTSSNYYNNYQKRLFALEDGGFRIYSRYSRSGSYTNVPSPNSDILTTGNSYITDDAFVIEYDAQGKPKNNLVRLFSSYSNTYNYPDDYISTVATGNSACYGGVVKVDDGYIVAVPRSSYYSNTSVKLDSGEKINLTGNILIFKVNNDSKIVWLKQYNSSAYSDQNIKSMFIDNNNRLNITFYSQGAADSVIIEEVDGEKVLDTQGAAGYYNVVFDISEVVYPSAAEAYTLNIDNVIKEYKVNVSTGSGSTITIKDNGTISYQGNGPVLSEKVKYGNNSKKDITISLDPGYIVTSVKANNKDLSYKINDDLSITLDKINNIIEDQSIEISTELSSSNVIVHHYKENTTERIASDEIISGTYGLKYETAPIVSSLYSLITDSEGKYILPSNYIGTFAKDSNIVVTYYYKENNVTLEVNYYIDNTSTELAPKKVEKKILGSKYKTEPANIDFYKVSRVVGEEEGTLNKNRTSVTYFYQESKDATINVKYVDIESGKQLSDPLTYTVERHQTYETVEATDIPKNYRLKNKTNNYRGEAESATINVVYYYEVIPFNASIDKRINSIIVNDEAIKIKDPKIAKLEQRDGDTVIVYYDIVVKNTGDIKTRVEVKEQNIDNFEIYDVGDFTETKDGYITNAELEPGEEKKYRIGYKWNQKGYGTTKNNVELTKVTNELGFAEPDTGDNASSAEIVLGIPTGVRYRTLFIVIFGSITSFMFVTFILTRRKRRIS